MKTKISRVLLLFLLSTFTLVQSFSQIPYVYSSENTATGFALPQLPGLADCPDVPLLPDPFAWTTGIGHSAAFSDWEHHRADFKAMIEKYEIGTKPFVDKATQVTASYADNKLTVNVTVNGKTLVLTCNVSIPAGATAPYPICIGMNSTYGSVTASDFTSRGIVGVTYAHNQVTTYYKYANTDPFFTLYPNQNVDNTGQYAAWAWGVSRIIDGLEIVKAAGTFDADLKHICVTGCSYAGKMALFSGAFDERIALVIAQESGGGGATSWRYSNTLPLGTVEGVAQTNNSWFKNSLFDFGGKNVSKLPTDHHLLMAMCAPRALYATGNSDYPWLSNMSNYVCDRATKQIYDSLGIADRFGFNIDGGHGHCVFPAGQEPELAYFLDKFMKGNTSLSQVITTHPAEYDTIDYAKWTSWWGPIAVKGISVSPATLAISAGLTSQLTPVFIPYNATSRKLSWSTSNSAVATVSPTGLLTAVANGTATITATTEGGAFAAHADITVKNIAVTGVSLNLSNVTVGLGAVSQLDATVTPLYAKNKNFKWKSSNSAIATVSSTGLVTGVAIGTATISAITADGSKKASSDITVTPSSPVFINVGGKGIENFAADQYATDGTIFANTSTIDISQITSNPPPATLFNTERYGEFRYTIPNRPVGSKQKVTLYFVETYQTSAGMRLFNVIINGTTVLTNFDIFGEARGKNKGIAKTFTTMANSSGQVIIQFVSVADNPKLNGIVIENDGSVKGVSAK